MQRFKNRVSRNPNHRLLKEHGTLPSGEKIVEITRCDAIEQIIDNQTGTPITADNLNAIIDAIPTSRIPFTHLVISPGIAHRILNMHAGWAGGTALMFISNNSSHGASTGSRILMVRGLYNNPQNFNSSVSNFISVISSSGLYGAMNSITMGIDAGGFLTFNSPMWLNIMIISNTPNMLL